MLKNDLKDFFLDGVGKSVDGSWYEPSFLVNDISREASIPLAKKYNQAAILYGVRDQNSDLIFIEY